MQWISTRTTPPQRSSRPARSRGRRSTTARANSLGSIHDLMIDKISGNVAYAIMSFGGFLGIGNSYHPLPWPLLQYDTTKGGYVVNLDKTQLEGRRPMTSPPNPPGTTPNTKLRIMTITASAPIGAGPKPVTRPVPCPKREAHSVRHEAAGHSPPRVDRRALRLDLVLSRRRKPPVSKGDPVSAREQYLPGVLRDAPCGAPQDEGGAI